MRKLLRLTLALALCGASPALATTLAPMDVEALTRASDLVVLARVEQSQPRLTASGGRIITDTTLVVLGVFKGLAGERVTAMQPGGEVGELGQLVHGVARFVVGEEVVVFLEQRGHRYTVTGMMQGRFVINRPAAAVPTARQQFDGDAAFLDGAAQQRSAGSALALPLAQLEAQVRAAAAAAPLAPEPPPPGRPQGTGTTTP